MVDVARLASALDPESATESHAVHEQAPRAHARSPLPHVRRQRMERLDADLPRRRDEVRQIEAETAQRSRGWGDADDRGFWDDLRETPYTVAAFGVFLLLLFWLFWG